MENMIDCGSGWGSGGNAAIGAFIGSWFGQGGFGPNARNDVAGTNVLEAVNNVNTTLLQGQAQSNMAAAQGFAGLNTVVTSGDASVTASINQASYQNLNALTQGFAGLNTAILTSAGDNRFAMQAGLNSLQSQAAECCCELRTAIGAEGAATRQLIQQNLITELQTQLCDSKSKAAALESQVFLQGSQAAQTNQIIQTVIAHLPKVK